MDKDFCLAVELYLKKRLHNEAEFITSDPSRGTGVSVQNIDFSIFSDYE